MDSEEPASAAGCRKRELERQAQTDCEADKRERPTWKDGPHNITVMIYYNIL